MNKGGYGGFCFILHLPSWRYHLQNRFTSSGSNFLLISFPFITYIIFLNPFTCFTFSRFVICVLWVVVPNSGNNSASQIPFGNLLSLPDGPYSIPLSPPISRYPPFFFFFFRFTHFLLSPKFFTFFQFEFWVTIKTQFCNPPPVSYYCPVWIDSLFKCLCISYFYK